MKWGEKLFGSKEECLQYLYQVVNQLAGGVLELDGKEVVLPEELHLEYKVKYAEDPGESKFSLKIAWANDIPMEELVGDEWQEEVLEEAPVEATEGEVPVEAAPEEAAVKNVPAEAAVEESLPDAVGGQTPELAEDQAENG